MLNTVISWLKTKAIIILLILLGFSIVANVYLYRGLTINWYTTNNSQSISNSYSSSAAINETLVNSYYHMSGKWTLKKKTFYVKDSVDNEIISFLNTLNPIQFKFTKQIPTGDKWSVAFVYPDISDIESSDQKVGAVTTTKDKGVK